MDKLGVNSLVRATEAIPNKGVKAGDTGIITRVESDELSTVKWDKSGESVLVANKLLEVVEQDDGIEDAVFVPVVPSLRKEVKLLIAPSDEDVADALNDGWEIAFEQFMHTGLSAMYCCRMVREVAASAEVPLKRATVITNAQRAAEQKTSYRKVQSTYAPPVDPPTPPTPEPEEEEPEPVPAVKVVEGVVIDESDLTFEDALRMGYRGDQLKEYGKKLAQRAAKAAYDLEVAQRRTPEEIAALRKFNRQQQLAEYCERERAHGRPWAAGEYVVGKNHGTA